MQRRFQRSFTRAALFIALAGPSVCSGACGNDDGDSHAMDTHDVSAAHADGGMRVSGDSGASDGPHVGSDAGTLRTQDASIATTQDGGHDDGGQRDGGHYDGGHYDGGHYDGGHYDGGQRDGGHHDGGQRDGGHHNDNPDANVGDSST